MALGIFIGILPIMGIQMAVVALIAFPFKGNLKAAIAGVWVSNPITFIPMYWGYYKFGLLFYPAKQIGWERFGSIIEAAASWDWANVKASLVQFIQLGEDILIPMWIGASILAVALSIPTYFVTFRMVVAYRVRRAARRARRAARMQSSTQS